MSVPAVTVTLPLIVQLAAQTDVEQAAAEAGIAVRAPTPIDAAMIATHAANDLRATREVALCSTPPMSHSVPIAARIIDRTPGVLNLVLLVARVERATSNESAIGRRRTTSPRTLTAPRRPRLT